MREPVSEEILHVTKIKLTKAQILARQKSAIAPRKGTPLDHRHE